MKEFREVRSLALVILEQRSDIEQFFLEALEQIKDEIRKKIQADRKAKKFNPAAAAAGISLPGESEGDQTGDGADKT